MLNDSGSPKSRLALAKAVGDFYGTNAKDVRAELFNLIKYCFFIVVIAVPLFSCLVGAVLPIETGNVFPLRLSVDYEFLSRTNPRYLHVYCTLVSLELISAGVFIIIYFRTLKSSKHRVKLPESSDYGKVALLFSAFAGAMFLSAFVSNDFSMIIPSHSWFEDNTRAAHRYLPMPETGYTAFAFGLQLFIFIVATSYLAELALAFFFGSSDATPAP